MRPLRIIDNKRINLTDSEYQLYQNICRSYDAPARKGEDLFKDLFETNQQGIIVFLKPPTKNFSSMEVYMFLVTVFIHQHIGAAVEYNDSLLAEIKAHIQENKALIVELRDLKAALQGSTPPVIISVT